MEERRRDRLLVEVQLRADPRDAPRVVDELLARAPHLAAVALLGDLERPADEVAIDVRVVRLDAREQLLDEVLVMALGVDDRHDLSVRAESEVPLLRGEDDGDHRHALGDEALVQDGGMRLVQAYLERRRLLRMMQLLAATSRR